MLSMISKYISMLSSLSSGPVYLVGGTVRDLLAGKSEIKDIDILMPSGSMSAARRFADEISGSFFVLEEERGMSRVVRSEEGAAIQFDFADFIGPDLRADLARRDFTINAMAIELRDYLESGLRSKVLDPFGGRQDIQDRLIRVVRPDALDEDPLRLLRAVRLSASLGFRIEKKTEKAVSARSGLVTSPSPERIKDELFQMLSLCGADRHLSYMDFLGLLLPLFPELAGLKGFVPGGRGHDVLTHSIKAVGYIDSVLDDLAEISPEYSGVVLGHLEERLEQFVTRKAALRFACLFHDISKPETYTFTDGHVRFTGHDLLGAEKSKGVCRRLRLSRETEALVSGAIRHHMRLFQLATPGGPSGRAMFRYCRDLGGDLPESIILSLADSRSTFENMPADKFLDTERYAAYVLNYYYGRFLRTEERPLVTGRDLIAVGLTPGPRFGEILDEIKEKQAEGLISTREEALEYIEKLK